MAMIERSAGIGVGTWVVGGGYSGATEQLDAIVTRAADLLAKAFGRNVEIRFNSDRRSGGAWVKDRKPGFDGNCQVGLTAGLKSANMSPAKARGNGVYIATYVAEANLTDARLANQGNPGHRYAHHYHDSLEMGLEWLKDNVDHIDD